MKTTRAIRGFSLVEMLVVMAILAVLMTSASMVTTSVIRSSQLSSDAANLADELAQASLESVKINKAIQFRFYRFVDQLNSEEPLVQAFQTLTIDSEKGEYVQLGNIRYLSQGIAIHNSLEASSILTLPERVPTTTSSGVVGDPELTTIAPYTYYEFEFRPDGSTNLPKDKTWGIVLAYPDQSSPDRDVPQNFRALGINPFTGAIKRY